MTLESAMMAWDFLTKRSPSLDMQDLSLIGFRSCGPGGKLNGC